MSLSISRRSTWHTLGACGMALGSQAGWAQDGAPAIPSVQITGTRLALPGAESPSPLQILSAADIAASGATNLQELLQKNPTLGAPAFSRANSNFLPTGGGIATVNLRNLGEARTLVLVNGRRFVAGVSGSSAVDLNAIPTDFIERVELMTGGASATYGSDAVAGVINIILKRNLSGLSFDAGGGRSSHGDDFKKKLALSYGLNSADGRSSLMANLAYSRQGAVYSRDRDISADDQISKILSSGQASDAFVAVRNYSSAAPQGRFFYNKDAAGKAGNYTYDRNGNVIPWSTNGDASLGLAATGFNRSAYRTIAVPTERYLLALDGEHAFTPAVTGFVEANYSSTKVRTIIEPLALSSADFYKSSNGQVPAETMVNGIAVRNPLVPQYLFDRITDTTGDGLRDYSFSRRLAEVGNRQAGIDRDTSRLATGLKGTLDGWRYDSYLVYGKTRENQRADGQVDLQKFRNALQAIPDASGAVVCADAAARTQGCAPLNLFGYNTISPAALAYVTVPSTLAVEITQKLAGASVSGEPFALPAGKVGLAAGFEWRKESSSSVPDALTQGGLNSGAAIPATAGSFSVREFFAEARLPLLKDYAYAKDVSFLGAFRSGHYSTVGTANSWNAGFEWRPADMVKLRATRALSTRAPNINELFLPPSQVFPTGIVDPCSGVTASSQGARDSACRADAGVMANIAANGKFTLSQTDIQALSGFNRGNPDLKAEQGRSSTVGVVLTPGKFTFTVDYFDIKIADAIIATPRQYALDQCYNAGNSSFCKFITRRASNAGAFSAGALTYVDSAVSNSGGTGTSGVDLTGAWAGQLGPGRLAVRLAYTYLKEFYAIPLRGAPADQSAGEVGFPRNKAMLNLGYQWQRWTVRSTTSYIGASALDDQLLSQFKLAAGSVKVGAKTVNDFQFSYALKKTISLYLGIDNAFNTKPAPVISGLTGDTIGTETNASVYDPIGRRYYLGVRGNL
ncbi:MULTISPECIES: TonB-dependent receptor domain-containing protein [unclassified Duganella]|uniref:TonB-dependent receptor domain-containing protein n=1 Tax=unclassified Duganella TaxID=2636909 RepID=UPI000E349084|nr:MULTISPECIES: TonB-dependent receptor [unclassified Duganella]RFP08096.1 TonB-dependent receptor [Duganella sp. BJB475]RFP36223.1 TonB-dependent receptor [Duganella sp. BJB476]